jgi:hypothetical protein
MFTRLHDVPLTHSPQEFEGSLAGNLSPLPVVVLPLLPDTPRSPNFQLHSLRPTIYHQINDTSPPNCSRLISSTSKHHCISQTPPTCPKKEQQSRHSPRAHGRLSSRYSKHICIQHRSSGQSTDNSASRSPRSMATSHP